MCILWVYSGLEDQLLGQVVAEERPDLEEAKNQLIISNAQMKQELKAIEDEILFRLSSTEGNPVDNEELIQVLEASKIKAGEIKVRQSDSHNIWHQSDRLTSYGGYEFWSLHFNCGYLGIFGARSDHI